MKGSVPGMLYNRVYPNRRSLTLIVYGAVAAIAYLLAYLLRFELQWPAHYADTAISSLPVLVAIRVLCSWFFHLTSGRWRYVSVTDVVRLVLAVAVGSVAFLFVSRMLPLAPAVPLSVILLEGLLTTFLTAALWGSYRLGFEYVHYRQLTRSGGGTRILIVGAGSAGYAIAHEMERASGGFRVAGFVDDDPAKLGTRVLGAKVLGTTADLKRVAVSARVDELVIAMPSVAPEQLRRVVEQCERTGLPFKVLPGIAAVLAGDVQLSRLREVRIEDLLGREPIRLELPELAEDLGGRTVLITGAGGSIGSELARQVALHAPACLLLLDQAETDLFYIELELRERHPSLNIVAIVGDIVDSATVERVFDGYRPDRVFHAAAYKHVPMMESNECEAIRNNVIGTWRVADAAGRHGTEKFVLVSTDKAVRPANVMGATKRLAEMVVLELQEPYRGTAYSAVRFGNVLGSNGSVLPVFRRQLAEGKPLTVTHPDATRFFMTIPEAVQLILQASLLPELRGNIAMLDMGEPVRIADLARRLLHLSGASRQGGTGIVFTGLRPGEKLHEELVAPDERARPTRIPKVRLLETSLNGRRIGHRLPEWEHWLRQNQEDDVLHAFEKLFPGLRESAPDDVSEKVASAVAS